MVGAVADWSMHRWILSDIGRFMSFYNYTLTAFGATHLCMIGSPAVAYEHTHVGITYASYTTLDDVVKAFPGVNLVALCNSETKTPATLNTFVHPAEDVLYVVGSDYGDLDYPAVDRQAQKSYVIIEGAEAMALWGHVALAIALHDRHVKGS